MTSGIKTVLWSIASAVCLAAAPFFAAASTSNTIAAICDRAAIVASEATGVPLVVLRAISLTETGRKRDGAMRPWPWTVNMEGTGKWFDNREAALDYVLRHKTRGARSFDVGCFQINYRWHGDAFTSVEQMFEPEANALYAARFLSDLHAEFGDWTRAAGAYHSRTPKYAKRYRARFARLLKSLRPIEDEVVVARAAPVPEPVLMAPVQQPRVNSFPLLQTTVNRRSLASLVPLGGATGSRLIEIAGE